jgi:DNA-binding response OmpR family regulator
MRSLLLLTGSAQPSADVLPALALLPHGVRVGPLEAAALLDAPTVDAVIVDGRRELVQARSLCRLLRATGLDSPLLVVLTEGGLTALTHEWGVDDVLLDTAGPAEVEARLRMVCGRVQAATPAAADSSVIRNGDLVIDEATYSARLRGRVLDLTFKEFELLKFLAQHNGRVFTRAQLLQEVWGYDYFGGTRTVDVHVRRLRAKLGSEHEALIGTVRNVGYKYVPDAERSLAAHAEPENAAPPIAPSATSPIDPPATTPPSAPPTTPPPSARTTRPPLGSSATRPPLAPPPRRGG